MTKPPPDRSDIRLSDDKRSMLRVPHTIQDKAIELRKLYVGTTEEALPSDIESLLAKLR